jgi:membrane associated rhomboid family serine protease
MGMTQIQSQWKWLVAITAILIGVEVINLFTGRILTQFGVLPRDLAHLPMIFTSPFVHGSVQHLLANLVTLWVFIALMGLQGQSRFIWISLWIITLTGLLVWLFGRTALHIGASGVVYGYFGFLVLAGWRSKRKRMLFVSVLIALIYGSLVFGILPRGGFISWESHLFGFISGLIAAWYWAK